jgi:hypothetical protein
MHIQTGNQPVSQITVIEPEQGKQAEALALMTERARFMARQPGFISISLHRSLDGRRIVAPSFSDAVRMHTIIDLIEHSSRTGRRVDVP